MTQSAGLKSFIELLETIGDNKYVFGDKLVEVGVSGPNLEATLAAIAMAQGELGHSRLLYYWVFDLKGYEGKKPDVKGQTGKAFRGVENVHNWITLIAALYTVNTAIDLILNSILEANRSKVVSRVNKLMREQKEHILYSRGWAQHLLEDKGAIPRKFKEALREITPEVGAWLREIEQKSELFAEGYLAKESQLYSKFMEELKDVPVQVV
ncbi:Phenylacetic acid catabolic protein [Thermoactinomyces mirandus]|uniref:Phenylacetate-CoA oxygenase subunit PaaI n=1 Tax=Thermoactinomyces mirandus TaxID=2756294 RepID=A0A7W1XV32_9BACL|nr:Phenylacetic acid catabolic protein [Thermoactinomyces mirandus]MBA4603824.1 phenylacetate-CoA oxygenase subunit PaaI [Thermoactinomyces mirandus]